MDPLSETFIKAGTSQYTGNDDVRIVTPWPQLSMVVGETQKVDSQLAQMPLAASANIVSLGLEPRISSGAFEDEEIKQMFDQMNNLSTQPERDPRRPPIQ